MYEKAYIVSQGNFCSYIYLAWDAHDGIYRRVLQINSTDRRALFTGSIAMKASKYVNWDHGSKLI